MYNFPSIYASKNQSYIYPCQRANRSLPGPHKVLELQSLSPSHIGKKKIELNIVRATRTLPSEFFTAFTVVVGAKTFMPILKKILRNNKHAKSLNLVLTHIKNKSDNSLISSQKNVEAYHQQIRKKEIKLKALKNIKNSEYESYMKKTLDSVYKRMFFNLVNGLPIKDNNREIRHVLRSSSRRIGKPLWIKRVEIGQRIKRSSRILQALKRELFLTKFSMRSSVEIQKLLIRIYPLLALAALTTVIDFSIYNIWATKLDQITKEQTLNNCDSYINNISNECRRIEREVTFYNTWQGKYSKDWAKGLPDEGSKYHEELFNRINSKIFNLDTAVFILKTEQLDTAIAKEQFMELDSDHLSLAKKHAVQALISSSTGLVYSLIGESENMGFFLFTILKASAHVITSLGIETSFNVETDCDYASRSMELIGSDKKDAQAIDHLLTHYADPTMKPLTSQLKHLHPKLRYIERSIRSVTKESIRDLYKNIKKAPKKAFALNLTTLLFVKQLAVTQRTNFNDMGTLNLKKEIRDFNNKYGHGLQGELTKKT